ncbi:hypothetical protein HYDPIDRAFT_103826, partial [Hydnomerulius pinastri MD-312]
MSKCYRSFRQEFPDTWQEILATYDEADALGDMDKTVAQRQQLFHKMSTKFAQSFAAMAKSHAFEGAFVMAGSVVNQDGGLGFAFNTPGAENFFTERCRADSDEMIGHLKAHIYNKSSLATVAQAFDDDNQQEGPPTKKEADDDDNAPECSSDKVGCKWASGKLFPWKGLPAKLAKSGIVCYNYPGLASLPGEERQRKPKGGSKGISDLTLAECSILVNALSDTSGDGLHFKHVPELKADLMASRIPVIHGAAPDHNSPLAHAKRMFSNLKCDHKGIP